MLATCTAAALLLARVGEGAACTQLTADFIVLKGEATLLALEDDVRKDLEKVGVTVTTRKLAKDAFNKAMVAGDFNMAFSETWGPPYDPHSYAKSWSAPDEAHYAALKGLPAPMTQAALGQKIDKVLTLAGEQAREKEWKAILAAVHEQAIDLPFSGKRIPAVVGKRLSGYVAGLQQFDYPVHTLRVKSGSKTITVAPGGQTGLFVGVGRLDPHTYRPNEFFASNWVYEGLVEYGKGGVIQPALALSWTVASTSTGGQQYTFALRQGVKFHDGEDWNCSVAKLNFDPVLAKPLRTGDWHGWYGLPGQISSWSCTSNYVFVLTTKARYYPLLQELSYIRPLRMLSPAKFRGGLASDPLTQNSCHVGWGNITAGSVTVNCRGILGAAGTGRWKYNETKPNSSNVQEVVFDRYAGHWETAPGDAVDRLRLVRYASHAAVKSALIAGTLDLVVGSGVLNPADVAAFKANYTSQFEVVLTEPIQNRIIILNSNKVPTDQLLNRKLIVHAVNKAAIIDKELYGLAEPVDTLFPKTAPYCHVDLTPRWDYDLEKAKLLQCPQSSSGATEEKEKKTDVGLILGIVAAVIVVMGAAAVALFFFGRSVGFKAARAISVDKRDNPMVDNADDGAAGVPDATIGKSAESAV
jgi:ABC-type transport system substrate-binding protein